MEIRISLRTWVQGMATQPCVGSEMTISPLTCWPMIACSRGSFRDNYPQDRASPERGPGEAPPSPSGLSLTSLGDDGSGSNEGPSVI